VTFDSSSKNSCIMTVVDTAWTSSTVPMATATLAAAAAAVAIATAE
jgi:hypothetical protein